MPDFGAPVALGSNIDPSQPLKTLSGLLSLKQQQQQLQTGQYEQQIAQAGAQTNTRVAAEQQRLASVPWDAFQNDDGSMDLDKATKAALKVGGSSGPAFAERFSQMAKEGAASRQAANDLNQNQLQPLRSGLAAWGVNPDSPLSDLITQANAAKDNAPASTKASTATLLDNTISHITGPDLITGQPKDLAAMKQAAIAYSRAGLSSAEASGPGGLATPGAGSIETPTNIYPTTVNRATGIQTPTGQNIPKGLPAQIVTYPNKQLGQMGGPTTGGALESNFFSPHAVTVASSGGARTQSVPPGKLQPLARPPANAPGADIDNYNAQIANAGQEYRSVSQTANDPMNGVQATRFRNQQIIDLAPHAQTGPGMKVLNAIASRIPGASGDAYQDLEHYAAQNSAALAQRMGVPSTNLGAETAAAAAGNVERNPGALLEITRTNDALNTASDLYNRGLAKVTNNGSDMSRVASYKQAFGANLDVNAVRWADAHRRGDKQEIQQLQQKFGPQGIAGFTQKLNTLKSLATVGDLPQ